MRGYSVQFEWPPALSCGQCLRASRRVALGDPAEVEDDVGLDLTRAVSTGMLYHQHCRLHLNANVCMHVLDGARMPLGWLACLTLVPHACSCAPVP